MKKVIVFVPVYNEEESLPIFIERIQRVFEKLNQRYKFELLFANNASIDGTLDVLVRLKSSFSNIRYVTFSRNFGYQASLVAGLTLSEGDFIVIIDADCEDPPELIEEFLNKSEEGYDIVYGRRINRPESSLLKFLRKTFYMILKLTADANVNLYMAEFSLLSNRVREVLIEGNNSFPFLRSEIANVGFKQFGIDYTRESRVAGRTNYNFQRMTLFALAGILSSSTFLLRMIAYLFPFVFAINIALFFFGESLLVSGLYFNFIYLNFLFFAFSFYLARLYKNILRKPLFIIDELNSSY